MLELRQYQKEALNALWSYWRENEQGVPLIVAPTGSGKSLIIAALVKRLIELRPQIKIIICAHIKELVEQNASELQKLLPNEVIGIYAAGLRQKNLSRVTYASIQSIYKKDVEADLFVCDESHLFPDRETSMYQKFVKSLYLKNHRLKIVGLTATPYRLDRGSLIGGLFTDIVYDISLRRLIDEGFLAPLISQAHEAVDLTGVKKSGYDFNVGDLEKAFDPFVDHHTSELIKLGSDRKSWLVFCSGVKHAHDISAVLNAKGIPSDYVSGEMMPMERDQKILRFKKGEIRALANCQILTTGFNHPEIDLIALLRSTASTGLFVQMNGRGMRTAQNKRNCLVLDFGGNIERHGPIDCIEVKAKKEKGEKAEITILPTKKCPFCMAIVQIRTRFCPYCQHEFASETCLLETRASERPILSQIEELSVKEWSAKVHAKDGKAPSLWITYKCAFNTWINDWLCFEHSWYPRSIAVRKWRDRGGEEPAPKTVQEAFNRIHELKPPATIQAIKKGKWYEIQNVTFKTEIDGLNI